MKAMVYSNETTGRYVACAVRTTDDGKSTIANMTGTKGYWENRAYSSRLNLSAVIDVLKVADNGEEVALLTEDDYTRRVIFNLKTWHDNGYMVKGMPDGYGGYGPAVPCRNLDKLKAIYKLIEEKGLKVSATKAEVTDKVKAMVEAPSTEAQPAKAAPVVEAPAEPNIEDLLPF